MLNVVFVVLVVASILVAAFTGHMEALTRGTLDAAGHAVTVAIGLIGAMAFFLGLLRVAADGGLTRILARAAGPILRRVFPEVPADHPAMSAMLLNIACTFLGLGNAATPFGIRAMRELERLNRSPGTATDAMVVFLAINTAGLALLPTGVIAMRASLGSVDPAGILVPTWIAGACATATGVAAALLLQRLPGYRSSPRPAATPDVREDGGQIPTAPGEPLAPPRWARLVAAACAATFATAALVDVGRTWGVRTVEETARGIVSYWVLPGLIGGLVLFGWARGVRVYASFVEGAREGFEVAVRIIPYLVAILAAVAMFRASGAMDGLVGFVGLATERLGVPAEALPVALMRPLSGSGSYALMGEVMTAHGPDSLVGRTVSAIQGSTETTFYVLAVYFGAVGIRRTRHALPACLLADLVGIGVAIAMVRLLFG